MSAPMTFPLLSPDRVLVSLKYQGLIDAAGTLPYGSVPLCSSAYDPQWSAGGGNCTGYSQWMGIYSYCLVRNVSITATYHNTIGSASTIFIQAYPSSQVGSSASVPLIDNIKEGRNSVFYDMGYNNSLRNPYTLTHSYNVERLEGTPLTPKQSWSSTASSSPTLMTGFMAGYIATNSTSLMTGRLTYDVTFSCELYQRRVFGTA